LVIFVVVVECEAKLGEVFDAELQELNEEQLLVLECDECLFDLFLESVDLVGEREIVKREVTGRHEVALAFLCTFAGVS